VARVAPLASEVVIATSTRSRRTELARHLPNSVRFLLDQRERWGAGPGAAMASARAAFGEGPVLFVPGDAPWIETRAIRRFVAYAEANRVGVAAPYWASGATEHLIQWHRDPRTVRSLPWSNAPPGFPHRASEFLRAAPRTMLVPISALSPHPRSFSHITYPSDLHHPARRGVVGGSTPIREVAGAPKRWYRAAHAALTSAQTTAAALAFVREARWYENAGLPILARHALDDATEAERQAPGAVGSRPRPDPAVARSRRGSATVNPAG
jgi:molybdopterin-guanine dinucleotide biosynthesis protein A